MYAIIGGAAWLVGVYGGSLFRAPVELLSLGIVLFAGLILIWWPSTASRFAALFALVLLLGLARSSVHYDLSSRNEPSPPPSGPVRIVGAVAEEPQVRDRSRQIVLEAREVLSGKWKAHGAKVLVRLARFPEFRYGDVLDLSGELKRPTAFEDFDYPAYLAQRGIRWVMDYPQVRKVGSGEGVSALDWIYGIREALTDVLDRSLPEPQSSLAAGVLLGIRTTIPDDLLDAFSRTNTYHILAISGLNISLLCGLLSAIGRRLWNRKYNVAFLLAGIFAYAAIVGPQPSVVRASIMGALLVIAHSVGRPADTIAWLLLAACVMTAFNPELMGDIGFQLSFAATAGLALLVPVIQPYLSALPRWLSDSLSVTFAAQIATLPITAVNFGQLSLVTPLANLLVVPAVLPLMVGSALTAVIGLLFEPAGQLAGWATWVLATYMIVVVERLGSLPWASIALGRFELLPVVPYYGVLALMLVGSGNPALGLGTQWLKLLSRIPAKWVVGSLGMVAVVVWAGALSVPSGPTTVSFFDVGQGDSILIRTASGRRVLVDGGPSPSTISNLLDRELPFWDRSIDLAVLTHANDDHLTGLIDVIERHDVRLVLDPAVPNSSAAYARWLEVIRRKNIRSTMAQAGQEIALDDQTRLLVLHPNKRPPDGGETDPNEYSIVLKLVVGDVSVLLTGDAGQDAQREMLASGRSLAATILKVPHHGGAESLDDDFLSAVRPRAAIISVGTYNRFGHPSEETLRKLEGVKVYRTDLQGTVVVGIENQGYWVRTRDSP